MHRPYNYMLSKDRGDYSSRAKDSDQSVCPLFTSPEVNLITYGGYGFLRMWYDDRYDNVRWVTELFIESEMSI